MTIVGAGRLQTMAAVSAAWLHTVAAAGASNHNTTHKFEMNTAQSLRFRVIILVDFLPAKCVGGLHYVPRCGYSRC